MNSATPIVWRWLEAKIASGGQLAALDANTIAVETRIDLNAAEAAIQELKNLDVLTIATDEEVHALAQFKQSKLRFVAIVDKYGARHFLVLRVTVQQFLTSLLAKRELLERQRRQLSDEMLTADNAKLLLKDDEAELSEALGGLPKGQEVAAQDLVAWKVCQLVPFLELSASDWKNVQTAVYLMRVRFPPSALRDDPAHVPKEYLMSFRGKSANEIKSILESMYVSIEPEIRRILRALIDFALSNEFEHFVGYVSGNTDPTYGGFAIRIILIRQRIAEHYALFDRLVSLKAQCEGLEAEIEDVERWLRRLNDGASETEERISRPPIPVDVQREVWRRDEGRCIQCGSKERLEYDHIIPVSRGGSNTARNIQLLCEVCNRSKGNRIGPAQGTLF